MVISCEPQVMQDGRTIPTPQVHALMLEALQLQPGAKVLEVGTGSGTTARYLATALCDCLCDGCQGQIPAPYGKDSKIEVRHCGDRELCTQGVEVHTVELLPLYGETIDTSDENVYFHAGDGKLGLEHEAPFDAIVVSCGMEKIPTCYEVQLKEGGKLVAPLGSPAAQRLVLAVKTDGILRLQHVVAYVRFSMMREVTT